MQGMKSGLLLLLPPLALAGNHWNVTLPGGSMRFQGLIMASSCRVEAGDRQMTVNLGQISSNRISCRRRRQQPNPFRDSFTGLQYGGQPACGCDLSRRG
ncbi:type 1 pilus biosynthesis fimbrial protein [Klebsiella pneumoniae]|uniref:Type 1 pilus biosynthesis fimbrial protein n=1 Tax=Klebsiella pneumoniae TaxID=573 RepID=A0A2X3H9R2_KLEPN|nr:type 1 pilus biosynthesis fimbrial protein [Klebsiella pneumoniae]